MSMMISMMMIKIAMELSLMEMDTCIDADVDAVYMSLSFI